VARLTAPKPEPRKPLEGLSLPDVNDAESYEKFTFTAAEQIAEQIVERKIKEIREQEEARQREAAEAERKRLQTEAFDRRTEEFGGRFQAAIKASPDLMNRIDPDLTVILHTSEPGDAATPASVIGDAVFESEYCAELLAFFSEHPDEVKRIAALPTANSIARAVGWVETQFKREADPKPKPTPAEAPRRPAVSQAEPPVRPLASSAVLPEEDIDAIEDVDEYIEKANARDARMRRGGR